MKEQVKGGLEGSSFMYLIESNLTNSEESEKVILCGKCVVPVALNLGSFP